MYTYVQHRLYHLPIKSSDNASPSKDERILQVVPQQVKPSKLLWPWFKAEGGPCCLGELCIRKAQPTQPSPSQRHPILSHPILLTFLP